jgi:hypothetical protein
MFKKALMDGSQMPGGAANPVGERRTVERDPLPGVDLRLVVERQMIGEFWDRREALRSPASWVEQNIFFVRSRRS